MYPGLAATKLLVFMFLCFLLQDNYHHWGVIQPTWRIALANTAIIQTWNVLNTANSETWNVLNTANSETWNVENKANNETWNVVNTTFIETRNIVET